MHARFLAALGTVVAAAAAAGSSPSTTPPAAPGSLPGRIAYSTTSGDLWVMNADGSCRRRLTSSGPATDYDPSLSPDGSRVVFTSDRAPGGRPADVEHLFVVSADGSA